jgi:hypothetical protein
MNSLIKKKNLEIGLEKFEKKWLFCNLQTVKKKTATILPFKKFKKFKKFFF